MAAAPTVGNKKVLLRHYVTGSAKEDDMEVVTGGTIALKLAEGSSSSEGKLLLKNLYLSCDPYMRGRMTKHDQEPSYIRDFVPGEPIMGLGVCKVVDSRHPGFKPGDLLWGVTGWEEYSVISNPDSFFKIQFPDFPLSYYTGVLGLHKICSPKEGEAVFVSAAAGAVGQLVGQLAKAAGCYVVGSAGSDEKVALLKNKLGFDDGFNYKKEPDLYAALKRCFPKGIDIYFDNVGGETLSAALRAMNRHGRIAACGMISEYEEEEPEGVRSLFQVVAKSLRIQGLLVSEHEEEEPEGVRNLFQVVAKSLRIQGLLVFEHYHRYRHFEDLVAGLLREGKIMYLEDAAEGLENAPKAFVGMLRGRNIGKQLVVVSKE